MHCEANDTNNPSPDEIVDIQYNWICEFCQNIYREFVFFQISQTKNNNWVEKRRNSSNIKMGCNSFDRVFMFDKIISAGLIALF